MGPFIQEPLLQGGMNFKEFKSHFHVYLVGFPRRSYSFLVQSLNGPIHVTNHSDHQVFGRTVDILWREALISIFHRVKLGARARTACQPAVDTNTQL